MIKDIRYAARTLIQNRGFTAIAVACLALGIEVNAAIFSMVDGVMLQRILRALARIASVGCSQPESGN